MDYKNIGKNIRDRRKELGYSQSKLAEIAGTHRNTISAIENGHIDKCIYSTVVSVAYALDITISFSLVR